MIPAQRSSLDALSTIDNFINSHQPKNGRFHTIAIDGRGGSGKSTFAELLKSKIHGFAMMNGDDYFEPIDDPVVWGDFNDDRFTKDVIDPLKTGNDIIYRPYDWHAKPHITERQVKIIEGFCLERCYSFTFNLDWDLKIWVETPKETCLERGIAREKVPQEKALRAWQKWQIQEDKYIRDFMPQRKADIVINGMKIEKRLH